MDRMARYKRVARVFRVFEILDFLDTLSDSEYEDDAESETESENENDTESETKSETKGNVNCPIKDIFDMFNDEQIVKTFRFDKQTILYITGLVEDGLPERYTESERKLLPVDQVLLALQFFATGTFQSVVANVLRVSQPSVQRSIHAVAKALCQLLTNHIFIDNTNLVPLQGDFAEIVNMPGVFGCIDGTHVRI